MTLLLIGNRPMPYDWGSTSLLQEFANLGTVGEPAAEVWFGAHPTAPSSVVGTAGDLSDVSPELGFMVKFLAAGKPLSIQAHPTKERAEQQFALKNPSYSDSNHKPEMVIAITEFEALCGFRSASAIESDLGALSERSEKFAELLDAFREEGIQAAMQFVFDSDLVSELEKHLGALGRARNQLFLQLAEHFPSDRGLVIALLFLEHIRLAPDQALYLPAGNIHAYLKGLAVEVMASSDNVLRGGLTPKHVDVPELMQVLDFSLGSDFKVQTKQLMNGLTHYPVNVSDFSVYRVEPSSSNLLIDLELQGSMIMVCISGELELSTSKDEYLKLKKGQAGFVSDARLFSVTGSGTGYLAMG